MYTYQSPISHVPFPFHSCLPAFVRFSAVFLLDHEQSLALTSATLDLPKGYNQRCLTTLSRGLLLLRHMYMYGYVINVLHVCTCSS